MHNFKEFKVWQRAIELITEVYTMSKRFPDDEKFSLTSQIRRSAVSIASNISEGAGRKTDKDFSNFLSISLGSQFELETQIIIANRIGYLNNSRYASISDELVELQKMTRTLIDKFSK